MYSDFMLRAIYALSVVLFIFNTGCASNDSPQPMVKVVIKEFRDRETGEQISEVTITVDFEVSEDLIFEDYNEGELIIDAPLGEMVMITINAPSYLEWKQGYRFKAAKALIFPVEMIKAGPEG